MVTDSVVNRLPPRRHQTNKVNQHGGGIARLAHSRSPPPKPIGGFRLKQNKKKKVTWFLCHQCCLTPPPQNFTLSLCEFSKHTSYPLNSPIPTPPPSSSFLPLRESSGAAVVSQWKQWTWFGVTSSLYRFFCGTPSHFLGSAIWASAPSTTL